MRCAFSSYEKCTALVYSDSESAQISSNPTAGDLTILNTNIFFLSGRTLVAVAYDVSILAACWFMAYWLRFNLNIPSAYFEGAVSTISVLFVVHLPIYWFFGLYRGIWRYASLIDLQRIISAVVTSSVLVAGLVFMFQLPAVPRSALILHPILMILAMGAGRFIYRAWRDRVLYGHVVVKGEPVIVLGAGDASERLLRELESSADWSVVGLLSNDFSRVGQELRGVKIVGSIRDIPKWVDHFSVRKVIVSMPEASQSERGEAIDAAVQAGLSVFTVPSLDDMLTGKVAISQVRQVQLEDLLGRDPVHLDDNGLFAWLKERVTLVTGAGGSIGGELVLQIARFRPSLIVMIDISEFALYKIEQLFLDQFPDVPIACIVGDVKDKEHLGRVFLKYRPAVVFHAAAYKHVPLMEEENSWQAVTNNVLGSKHVAEVSLEHAVEKFVLISTDKAVNPTNVMGATKRLAEKVLSSLQKEAGTRFITVRFGNVLGSNGSVIPKFKEQIENGGPVTVTHPEIIRYFMLIPEAAQLVLQAGLMGQGGEVFVLEMGEPIRIVDLARDMIRLSGFSEEQIKIKFTGLRPGEKLYEELLADAERTLPTPHPKLRVARSEATLPREWVCKLDTWLGKPAPSSIAEIKTQLQVFVPEYTPRLH